MPVGESGSDPAEHVREESTLTDDKGSLAQLIATDGAYVVHVEVAAQRAPEYTGGRRRSTTPVTAILAVPVLRQRRRANIY